MPQYSLSPLALEDLKDIWRYWNCSEIISLFSANREWGNIAPRNANQRQG